MSRYSFDDLTDVANLNPEIFDQFPTPDNGPAPTEETISLAEKQLGVVFPDDYRKTIARWGYLELGSDLGFFGINNNDPSKFTSEPCNVVYDTLEARSEIGLPKKYIVIFNDSGDGDEYGVIDVKTGAVLAFDRWGSGDSVELSESFIDYVFHELIKHRRSNEVIYETVFKWPEYLIPRISEDSQEMKEELDEFDELFDAIDIELQKLK